MKDFYTAFYTTLEHSQAHRTFCERVYGKDLGQHGFADVEQLELLIQVVQLTPGQRALDLGCGDGRIAEYLSDRTGAHFTGLDYIPEAIQHARQRTAAKADRLDFIVGDINQLELPAAAFDLILSVDTMYFSEDYTATIAALHAALKPGGQMAIFFSYGREPWVPVDEFPKDKLPPDQTPLAAALQANGLAFRTWDLTAQDLALALRRKEALLQLKAQFEADDALFIYENRLGDSEGIRQAIEAGLHARYLYWVSTPPGGPQTSALDIHVA
jgi:cyclopropane fatty-acyl-phospholipid synthase-like methyltransferase